MGKEPLFPHVPKKKEVLFPHHVSPRGYGPPETAPPEMWAIWHEELRAVEGHYPIGSTALIAEAKRANVSQKELQQIIAHERYLERRREILERYTKEERERYGEEEEEEVFPEEE